ncbi:ATP-dependent DNA helicase DDX11 isoform X2 [Ooceraea biroi]|uniref:ATP-dependent DNA helicase DDX11 isoform X2 n=1 Tax=Ooceraea biroi TaxID=2015173 RepID=UPI00097163E6|nr:ATP-dependent DNA helicase DDX11 isoform X2 [Ooceraea biroi]
MEPPQEFPFPFPAYEIQKQFMTELYNCLQDGKIGLFESPTGTGKSLSLICGALRWLVDHEKWKKQELISTIADIDEKIKSYEKSSDNWFSIQAEQIQLKAKRQPLQLKLDALVEYENERAKLKNIVKSKKAAQSKTIGKMRQQKLLDSSKREGIDPDICDAKDLLLEDALSSSESSEEEDTDESLFKNTKIFFCSRTHSQLTQFVHELKRSPYSEDISVVPLSSRQNYCINKGVKKLKYINLINETCLQLQRRKATVKQEKDLKRLKTTSGCPFVPGDQKSLMAEVLTNIQDVEEIGQKGQESNTCPYYGTRKSLQNGQLILVPYNSILHKNTRTSLGIDLEGNVLIIDEAHNLLDAIEGMHSCAITGRNLLHCNNQLSQYRKRFESLFSAKSVLYLSQLSFCLKKLIALFGATTRSHPNDEIDKAMEPKLYKIQEFELLTEIDTVNIFKLLEFVKASKLVHKLQGFVEQYGNNVKITEPQTKKSGVTEFLSSIKNKDSTFQETTTSVPDASSSNEEQMNNSLMGILSFLECLKNSCTDGRICVLPGATIGQGIIKFLLLNPAAHFHDIGASPDRIMTFSCDHVIPKENIISNIVTRGPTGIEFEFNFQNRQNAKLLDELGRALLNLCNIVPAGIVVFFPSYSYEDTVFKHLDKSGVIAKISAKKHIYREPKLASQVNVTLDQYAHSIKNPQSPCNGSLLFSVVGGKLSEGLNFSDDLGRCVIVVGLPYPNIKSPELQEKMKYLNEHKSDAGNSFYENSCMKAVNQCIGRSVRHINDYSTVVLLDRRYCHKIKALPRWIQRSVTINDSFGSLVGNVAKFFTAKRTKRT